MPVQKNKIPCSVPILTRNSERYLRECLESVRNFADVFLLDGNSTDSTRPIAAEFGVPVLSQVDTEEPNVKIENFGAMRKKAADMTKCDWILVLDSDEYITPDLERKISKIVAGSDVNMAYKVPYFMKIGEKLVKYSFSQNSGIRLYNKKSGIIWNSRTKVHEKFLIPKHVRQVMSKHTFVSHVLPARECREKDRQYITIARKKMLSSEIDKKDRRKLLQACFLNLGRSVNIIRKIMLVYAKHGYKNSLPVSQVLRYVKYFLMISLFRFVQFVRTFGGSM